MDTVAFFFCDEIASCLPNDSLHSLTQLRGSWSTASGEQLSRRVFLQIRVRARSDGRLEYVFICRGARMNWSKRLTLENLSEEAGKQHLIIESLHLGKYTWPRDSWKRLTEAQAPLLVALVDDYCEFSVESTAARYDYFLPLIDELRFSRFFRKLALTFSGRHSEETLLFQLTHGKLQDLRLCGSWPEETIVALHEFCKSASMRSLNIAGSTVFADVTLVRILVERFVNGAFRAKPGGGQIFEGQQRDSLTLESVRNICADMIPPPHRNSTKFVSWKNSVDERRLCVQRSNGLFFMDILQ